MRLSEAVESLPSVDIMEMVAGVVDDDDGVGVVLFCVSAAAAGLCAGTGHHIQVAQPTASDFQGYARQCPRLRLKKLKIKQNLWTS